MQDPDILLVSTLEKWLHSGFSARDFEEIKAAWQKGSVLCDQQVLSYFVEAATSRLADRPSYVYNLGLAGSSSGQLSFARIIKSSPPGGEPMFICCLNSILFRQGKILGLAYSRPIRDFAEIGPTIDAYMDYLRGLEAEGSAAGRDLGSQTMGRQDLSAPGPGLKFFFRGRLYFWFWANLKLPPSDKTSEQLP